MTFSALTILVLALVAAVVFAIGLWAYSTAHRLDRLHVRSDQSWQALDAALARRAVVARAVAVATTATYSEQSKRLAKLADQAERADRADREAVENVLSTALSSVDIDTLRPQLVAELADAEARVLIARRFHNDAVRDTLAIRTRSLVRVLHLGGTAPLPTYFEITERAKPSASTGLSVDDNRISARVVLLAAGETGEPAKKVLLLHGRDPQGPEATFWFTIGGGVQAGETLRAAAVREVFEETGRRVEPDDLRGPIWRRVAVFGFNGELIRSEELFFVLALPEFEPHSAGYTEVEQRAILGYKWCTPAEIEELDARGETVYPHGLAGLLDEACAALTGTGEPEVRSIR